ncbi:MAG: hypothetical protein MUC97_01695 [Bernardetiaceae bacterium]|nr:hypothetical protein [Bernardetiaceae bacterium]
MSNFSALGAGERIVVGRPASNLVTVFPPIFPTWNGQAWVPNAPGAADNAFVASARPTSPAALWPRI